MINIHSVPRYRPHKCDHRFQSSDLNWLVDKEITKVRNTEGEPRYGYPMSQSFIQEDEGKWIQLYKHKIVKSHLTEKSIEAGFRQLTRRNHILIWL